MASPTLEYKHALQLIKLQHLEKLIMKYSNTQLPPCFIITTIATQIDLGILSGPNNDNYNIEIFKPQHFYFFIHYVPFV